jgi:hypothetical protein
MEVMKHKKHPFNVWETYLDGMYKTYSEIENYEFHYDNSLYLLSNQDLFFKKGIEMIENYVLSCETFLQNNNINKIAFIGQATCCFAFKSPEIVVKDVWKILDIEIQEQTNETAKKILLNYEERNRKIQKKMGELWI